ncbi:MULTISPECIES: hypothetical protein [unclassified Treponema]|uniref:hypothetical protein n=1 Tax=unclassified Treponema TaxID=2638727 RepID=UPI0020A3D9D8|nr:MULTISPECIES: hypothetical protein [unclassified Treponema]UTC67004.1 hypothetical protein E4O06_13850 [Treponema sp. OMZ 789]UTC69733.1 hypothetical protein E4O01_13990 [Treponema sp. OMZ 790]UTC72447.1 hypothetical protein E4O02_14080 [Treponema sp. OMZ 791]
MIKYSKEALDEALLQAQSNDISMRTKGIRFLRQASCLEVGTKNTYPIRDWFSEAANYTKLFEVIQSEKDPKLLWEYLFLIKMYCERYIDSAHLVKNSETFIQKKENMEFKIKACKLGELFLVHQDASVRQAAASLLWYLKKTSEVWPIIIELMQKKHDYITLSHIGIMICNCFSLLNDDRTITDYLENTAAKESLISLKDAAALKDASALALEKAPAAAKKAGFNSVSETLDNIITELTKINKK